MLHVPSSVGGNPQGLSRHLLQLGVDSETWILRQNFLAYPVEKVIWRDGQGLLAREVRRWIAIAKAAIGFQVIHLNFGTCIAWPSPTSRGNDSGLNRRVQRVAWSAYTRALAWLELHLYRLLGRPLFVHYQGDDARQGDVSLEKFKYSVAQHAEPGYYSRTTDAFKRRMILSMSRLCDQIYAVNPDLMHVLPANARFVPYCHISLDDWQPVYSQADVSRPLRLGHAPTNRAVKGTARILTALDALRAEGHHFEIDLVEGVPHDEARRRYEHVDVLIDQLYTGWYGGLAVEAMALGKPVVVYIREEDLQFIPAAMRADLPFIRVTPDTIEEGLRRTLTMPRTELVELARRSRAFVERWHDPLRIATEIKADYEAALRKRRKL